ncbi:MAG: acetate--CoA ligase family protein [Anaerolineales bacterium]|nr:acetate--CoA ligase family protein [Anaerolineales bacterium]
MRDIFYPTTVAVIGVSAKPDNLGRNIVGNLVEYGFQGIVYAVGPSGGAIQTRRIYRSVGDIPDHIDLAVILTPAATVPSVLEECGQKGIRFAIIETAGFREFTQQGQQLELEIVGVAEKYGIRFVGPNCIGAINMENGFCVPFPSLKRIVKNGAVSIVTQSGGVGMSALNLMANEGLGLNKFVSVGNKLNINAEDMLEYLIGDEGTELIFMYLESIGDGRRMMEIARRSPKPILVFKSNIGKLGSSIALSHTASLASDDKVVDAAFHQAGILRVHDATALGNNMKILRLPPMRGRRLGVVSRSGGHAVMAADACELSGFDLAPFPDSFLREIERHFRASVIRLTNPLDLGDLFDLEMFASIVEGALQIPEVDGVVFLHTGISEAENLVSRKLLERIMGMVEQYDKPVAYYMSTAAAEVVYLKQHYDFPIFTQVVETVRALAMSHYYYHRQQALHAPPSPAERPARQGESQVRALIAQARKAGRDLLLPEALQALEAYGIPVSPSAMAASPAQAAQAAEKLGFPAVLKVAAEKISHKTDVGGVRLNLANAPAVEAAYTEMLANIRSREPEAEIAGMLVQPMAPAGQELILGGRHDPQFGPVLMVGVGGIFAEVYEDVVLRVAPIHESEAREMLESLHGYPILAGARGRAPSDLEAVVQALLRLSQLMVDFPEIQELDINPLRVLPAGQGCLALDGRIILSEK